MPQFVRNDNWDALIAVLEAVRIERTRQRHIFVSQSDRPGLREALEARFLKELMERFREVVKRAAGFDWLPFSDPQLREAIPMLSVRILSRCDPRGGWLPSKVA